MEEQPLVTCLCLTMAGRSEFLKRAVECFARQTYPHKELLIVADSWKDAAAILDSDGMVRVGSNISVYVTAEKCNIGRKRNLGIESAGGSDLIAIFDDDDFSAPNRLDFQVQSLQVSQKAVTGFQVCKFTDGASWWQYRAGAGFVVGSSLCFRRDWWAAHTFPEIQIGEDVQFCDVAHSARELAMCPDMDLMYATIHGGNTSLRRPEDHPHNYTSLPGYSWKERDLRIVDAYSKA